MERLYADVIIDISHEAIDRSFQYIIPESLMDRVVIGSQVIIPFGRGNTRRKGYVIGIGDKTEYDTERLKSILEVDDKAVEIDSQLIRLAGFIKERYGSTMINALKTVMPVKNKVKPVVKKYICINLDDNGIEKAAYRYTKKNAVARLRLLYTLKELNTITMEYATSVLNISSSTLKGMADEGVINIVSEQQYRDVTAGMTRDIPELILNEEQQTIVDEFDRDIDQGVNRTYLLHGVTGSGKTQVYVQAIRKVIEQGRQAIVLIPEISLTYQIVGYFARYFGDRVTVINSRLSAGEKYDQFKRAERGEVDVVIGPRSALFAPFKRLGLIIIDEEHENSYKSDYPPKYHAREVAIERAGMCGCPVILGSATPSVESYRKALSGDYRLWTMTRRARNNPMPECHIVDLRDELRRGNRSIISGELLNAIADRLEKHEQIMLFMNKRGYNSFVSCRSCGEPVKCPHCDVSLTRHYDNRLTCHYCGYTTNMPDRCPVCKSKLIGGYGTGTEKIEEEIKKLFPSASVLRMDRDTTSGKNSHQEIIKKFADREADILIGTQMIVKGHDFENVTLVGIILADLTLFDSDYRAAERTFDLLVQAAGRAGRGDKPGDVIIQTYKPDNYAIVNAAKQDYESFYHNEEAYRSLLRYPPVWNMLVIIMVSDNEKRLEEEAGVIVDIVNGNRNEESRMILIGPAVPVISKIRDMHRRVIYIKDCDYNELIHFKDAVEEYVNTRDNGYGVNIQFDFNPMNLY